MVESYYKMFDNYENGIFIQGNVPSLKNSKQYTRYGVVPSKTCQNYLKESSIHYYNAFDQWKEMYRGKSSPIILMYTFVRKTRHKFDFCNAMQTVEDIISGQVFWSKRKNEIKKAYLHKDLKKLNPDNVIQKLRWIEDDNCDFLVSIPNPVVIHDPKNAGVYLNIL